MTNIQIHQFAPTANAGDGITNGMFFLQKLLIDLGFESDIYVENCEKVLKSQVKHYTTIPKETTILFIHYSIYYDFSIWIDALDVPKHIIYHNITPYEFFEPNTLLRTLCKQGKEYLHELSSKFQGSIGDSTLNTEELQQHDFVSPKTIPLLIDADKVLTHPFNHALFDEKAPEFNIIFVGRIAKNKAQHDLIEVARSYKNLDPNFQLYIIGGTTDQGYHDTLQNLIKKYDLHSNVTLLGKISNEDLYAYYRAANLFLCMSEHEGFGMPLVESMLLDLPVFAYNSSNIKSTLNGGGLLFDDKNIDTIAAAIHILKNNPSLKRELLNTQREARKIYANENILRSLISYLKEFSLDSAFVPKPKAQELLYQFEGPFDSSYSLAILNRNAALVYDKHFPEQVSLYSTEGGGDFAPNQGFLDQNPQLKALHARGKKTPYAKAILRNLYPPRVTGAKAELNILNLYAWEESAFPKEYVESMNQNLDGIIAVSSFVKNILRTNGIKTPIKIIPNSIDHMLQIEPKPYTLKTKKKFKFLHISSCFPRKGIDTLLKAYTELFTKEDDVTLIIKTFPNPHNTVEEQIKSIKKTNPTMPEIELINQDLSDAHLKWLYQNSSALVAPSRAEGFGLPFAEAMLFHLPLITTAFGGQSDFCTEKTAWLIDYKFAPATSHLHLFDSYWAEPSLEHLKLLLLEQTKLTQAQREEKTTPAYNLVSTFTWQNYFKHSQSFIQELQEQKVFDQEKAKIAWISSYNTVCGIATYSDFLISNIDASDFEIKVFAPYASQVQDPEAEKKVTRCFGDRFDRDNTKLIRELQAFGPSHVLLNFNFGFFSMQNLRELIDALSHESIPMSIIFHSIDDVTIQGLEASLSTIASSLKKVTNLLVHTIEDLNKLKTLGLHNTNLFPHGAKDISTLYTPTEAKLIHPDTTVTLASYGFLLPHKGILELIEAFALLIKEFKNAHLLLVNAIYPADTSREYATQCKNRVHALHLDTRVHFHDTFLSDEDSYALLAQADLIVMPYRQTNESVSGAIRYALSTQKPTLCTPQPIFDDVANLVHFTSGYTSTDIYEATKNLLKNTSLLHANTPLQRKWLQEHSWQYLAQKITNYL